MQKDFIVHFNLHLMQANVSLILMTVFEILFIGDNKFNFSFIFLIYNCT